ncbi:HsdR family type I site-specific deoxyribonuclease (plasmid) [Sinomonas atrocyanea]|uniref:Type I restriction enzyme endonuclease subunit n=1 Tax=Sinomonas atrocyanea TaxID=37927 RepID=A0A127AAP8_9MICC|nr:type I restriction endonuclease subunit R [Sinomonas atrocyanea]AMM34752.1 HsdR family type I site-specific deoxyribonuclease [Sinomonas atrocyanea]GEB66248.1 DEAD/DEAH box helicase [Sinomonas atrocyanea]GGG80162.1 DEAD/DEAH box helicase [Sinomonas atrocyanea]
MTPTGPEYFYVEKPSIELLAQLGWTPVDAFQEILGVEGTLGRDSQHEVVLTHRLRFAMRKLNPTEVPDSSINEAIEVLLKDRSAMDRVRANREVHNLLRDGYRAEWTDQSGDKQIGTLRYLDLRSPSNNDLLAVRQMWVKGNLHSRRLDLALFVNGVPLVLMEFKEPNEPVRSAYDDNLTDYRDTIPQLFIPNCFVLLSNGSAAKVGSTYSPWAFFNDWKVIDARGTRGAIALETALRGTCDPVVLLDLVENFVAYMERPGGLIKVLARSHQYLGVNAAIENLDRARAEQDKRLGVFWHTQGSGKSLSMLWFTQKVLRLVPGKWTFVMVTDRTELDIQLHGEFADAGAISPEARVHAESVAHLRELLAADHRYVFTLIQKFQPSKGLGERQMPVLSDRSDVIVITDEAHRSQYDTLALNMRTALPNASMMGFTGTPLIAGEEQATREQFGDYVSIYNFRDAIEDGATVPLYYENRIPELQLVNEKFSDELDALLEEAELDEAAEGQLARVFGTQYTLLTRPDRLRTIAKDLVAHFVGRGFSGKAMYVGLDKAAAVRMYNLVKEAWAEHLEKLRAEHDALPELERPWLASRIELMETTDMAVVVSQSQNELKMLDDLGLDIRPHRERMNREDLAEKFKDSADPLRLVFVCAMWMTGFDAPSVSTVYLDRPMKNHTLMQTIARANRVFPEKDNGLIVDYVGVFRNLEKALAIYGAAGTGQQPIEIIDALSGELDAAVAELFEFCSGAGVDLAAMRDAEGFDHVAKRDAAVEALLVDEDTTTDFQQKARQVRKLFKALLPDPKAAAQQRNVAAIRVLAERIAEVTRPPDADLGAVTDAVDALLDRSVGAEEYVIRAAAEGIKADPLIDLSLIDFEGLAAKFAGRKRAETDRLAQLLRQRAIGAATRNPTRYELVERIEELITEYNAGSVNIDEYLRRLIELSQTLTHEEERSAREGMTEEELAIFDLLTQPDPVLTDDERDTVRASAKKLLDHLHDKLVQDWRRKVDVMNDVDSTIRRVLDQELPEKPYTTNVFTSKVRLVFDHVLTAYGDDGQSAYTAGDSRSSMKSPEYTGPLDVNKIADDVVSRIHDDPVFAAQVAAQLSVGKDAGTTTSGRR